ncbi:MAG TPA: DUF2630 family protein [Candidatus Dormibacteraeota bacterium]|nr:DUF2630 family protein [Candidatus Dormibacteraeota bacterium]
MDDPYTQPSKLGDGDLVGLIDNLVAEEHRLERDHAGEGLDEAGRERLRDLEVKLDQAWDLLRRRRARRDAGMDPDQETLRDPDIVEKYQQ